MNRRQKSTISLIYIYCILRCCSCELWGHDIFSTAKEQIAQNSRNCPVGVQCTDLRFSFTCVIGIPSWFWFLIVLSPLFPVVVLFCFALLFVWCKHHTIYCFAPSHLTQTSDWSSCRLAQCSYTSLAADVQWFLHFLAASPGHSVIVLLIPGEGSQQTGRMFLVILGLSQHFNSRAKCRCRATKFKAQLVLLRKRKGINRKMEKKCSVCKQKGLIQS